MRHVHEAQIRRGELGSSISISDGDAWCGERRDNQPMGRASRGGGKVAFSSLPVRYLRRLARCSAKNNISISRNHGEPKLTNDAPVHVRTHTQNPRQSSINSVRKENKGERAQRTRIVCPSHQRLSIRPRRASPSSSAAPSRRPRRSLPTAHSSSRFVSTRAASRRV